MIPQIKPFYNEEVWKDFKEYFTVSKGWITEDRYTRDFERQLAKLKRVQHCKVLSNGTVAITLLLKALGLPRNSSVILPAYTMGGSASAIIDAGLKPVFCDVEIDTLCLDGEQLESVVTSDVSAIMIVSMNGRYPKSADQIVSIAKKYSLEIIEDGAQSFCSSHRGAPYFKGAAACTTSFSMPKIITTGNGGAVFTEDSELYKKISMLADFGRRSRGTDVYEISAGNSKFSDIQAIFGINQLKDIKSRVEAKRSMHRFYKENISFEHGKIIDQDLTDQIPMFIEYVANSPKNRDDMIRHLTNLGIGTRKFYPNLADSPAFKEFGNGKIFPVSTSLSATGIWLPSSVDISKGNLRTVVNAINSFQT